MRKIFYPLLFWSLILYACSISLSSTDTAPLTPVTTTPLTPIIETLQTPHIDQSLNGNETTITPRHESCYIQWSYQDVPEISEKLDKEIKAINPNAQAKASAFGEDCVYPDGHTTLFNAMETDFYIHLTVSDLKDFKSFGNWVVQGMTIVEGLTNDLIVSPKLGLVEFWFIKNDSEIVPVRVPIEKYNNEATGKSGEELFRTFYIYPLPQ
jgi:hypothetical protein